MAARPTTEKVLSPAHTHYPPRELGGCWGWRQRVPELGDNFRGSPPNHIRGAPSISEEVLHPSRLSCQKQRPRRCSARLWNVALIRQSRPDFGLGFGHFSGQKPLKPFSVFPLGAGFWKLTLYSPNPQNILQPEPLARTIRVPRGQACSSRERPAVVHAFCLGESGLHIKHIPSSSSV